MISLRLESKQTGLSPRETSIFKIVADNTPESRQAMEILGIDAVAAMAENSSFLLNGTKHNSYSNTFTINNTFSVTLNNTTPKNEPVKIGFKPGSEAVTDDVQSLVDSFNSIIEMAESHSGMPSSNEKLLKDMGNVAKTFSSALTPLGLSVSDKGMISVDRTRLTESVVSKDADQNLGVLNRFKDAIGRKADEASLDPMNYVKKVLVFLFVMVLSIGSFKSTSVFAEEDSLLTITKTYGDGPFKISFTSSGRGKMTYSSSNTKVVTVSSTGKVTIKGCGIADVKIKAAATEKYKAKNSKVTIIVKPKRQQITDLKLDKRNITIKWNKDTKADGYYIYYSTDYKFSNDLNKVKITKNKTTSSTIKNLKTDKKYYVKVCSYKNSGKKIVKGDFSKIRNVKIQK